MFFSLFFVFFRTMLFENRPARCCSSRPTPTLYFDVCLPNHLTPSYCLGHCCTWYSGIGHWGTVGSRRYGSRSYADLRVRMVFTYEPGTSIYSTYKIHLIKGYISLHSCQILSPSETGFIVSAHRLTKITLLTLIATL